MPDITWQSTTRPWGDHLEDGSIFANLYELRWQDASGDDLVYLLPSLARSRDLAAAIRDGHGPAGQIRAALASSARRALDHLKRLERSNARRVLDDRLHRLAEMDGREPRSTGSSVSVFSSRRQSYACLAFELSAQRCIARLLAKCSIECDVGHTTIDVAPTLGDVVVASIQTGINAAYFFPDFDYAHERLTVAAWIGVAMGGRTLLLPAPLAAWIDDIIARGEDQGPDAVDRLLLKHLDAAIGRRAAATAAKGALRRQRPSFVVPRGAPWSTFAAEPWNQTLVAQAIADMEEAGVSPLRG